MEKIKYLTLDTNITSLQTINILVDKNINWNDIKNNPTYSLLPSMTHKLWRNLFQTETPTTLGAEFSHNSCHMGDNEAIWDTKIFFV